MNPLFKHTKRGIDFLQSNSIGVADMITLDILSEDRLLENLHMRFSEEIIYVCESVFMYYLL